MADKTLTCRDCGNEFVFTEGEQEKQRNNKIIEDNYIVCFLRSCIRLNFLIQSGYSSF